MGHTPAFDAGTMALLRESVNELLRDAGVGHIGLALTDLGWSEVVRESPAMARMLFDEQGALAADAASLDTVVSLIHAVPLDSRVVWPVPKVGVDGSGGAYSGIALGRIEAETLVTRLDSEVVVVEATSSDVQRPVDGFDRGSAAAWYVGHGRVLDRLGPWDAVQAVARRAVASELVGLGRGALDLAVEHVGSREQFGRPIGSFQSVRHRLAQAYARLKGADALVTLAWDEPSLDGSRSARVAAGQAHEIAVSESIQVCGAMGLSNEHRLPRYVRRGFFLDRLVGATDDLLAEIGRSVIDEKIVRLGAF